MLVKLIHCADLHLDSKLSGNLNTEQAKERRYEILATFQEMVKYAVREDIHYILIAGDLYDRRNISATARDVIVGEIESHPDIIFFYLKGNHDAETILKGFEDLPANLLMFPADTWRTYAIENTGVKITGTELTEENNAVMFDSLVLDNSAFNIVTLHGQQVDAYVAAVPGNRSIVVPLKSLANKGIDYLALGHVHAVSSGRLDNRGEWCYCGCLEGRGFDECGSHGFMVLSIDTEERSFSRDFVPIAKRQLHEVPVDVSACRDTHDAVTMVAACLKKLAIPDRDLVKVELVGAVDMECEISTDYLCRQLEGDYYFLKVVDRTGVWIDYDAFALDTSLKGEFVRLVKAQENLTEDEKAMVIQHGIKLLMGEIAYED